MNAAHSLKNQRGITLVIGLFMLLVVMMLIAVASYKLGSVQTVILSNAQQLRRSRFFGQSDKLKLTG